jgi:hypothetical protein
MGSPSFTQVAFRLRNDNGSETTATWIADQGSNYTLTTGTNFRVRFLIDETASRAWTGVTWNLYYSLNGGAYAAVTAATAVKFSASSQFADGADCTSQLTGGTGSFLTDNNGMKETTGGATNSGSAGNYFETEWCLQLDSTLVADGNTVALRIYNGTSAIAAYTSTPTITVSEVSLEQKSFRGRDDTQTLNSSTFSQSLNTNFSVALDTPFRLRFVVQAGTAEPASRTFYLYRSINAGAYSAISGNWYALSSQFANGDAATQVIATGTGTYTNGVGVENNYISNAVNLAASGNTEIEFILLLFSGDVNNGDTVAFRLYSSVEYIAEAFATYTNTPTITAGSGTNLTVQDANSVTQTDAVTLTQVHSLTVNDAASVTQTDAVSLTQVHNLIVTDAASVTQTDAVVLSVTHNLIVADAASVTQADAVNLTQVHNLTVQDADSVTQADAINLTQVHNLIVNDAASVTQADNVVISLTSDLIVADAASVTQADALTLTQAHNITVQDAASVTQADAVSLTQVHNLTVQDAYSETFADVVSMGGSITLTIADAASVTQSDNVTLTQVHALAVQDAYSETYSDEVSMGGSVTLTIQDAASVTQTDAVTVTQTHNLIVADGYAVTQTDAFAVTIESSLIVDDGYSSTFADVVSLVQSHILSVADGYTETQVDNVILSLAGDLEISDVYSATFADSVTLNYVSAPLSSRRKTKSDSKRADDSNRALDYKTNNVRKDATESRRRTKTHGAEVDEL